MKVRNYRNLIVWQRAMDLVEDVYKISSDFPREEQYGLTSQIRRAAVSVPSNIAEGQGRRTTTDFVRHLYIAYGSLREVETQTLIAQRLNYSVDTKFQIVMNRTGEVGRLLNGLMAALEK